MKNFQLRVVIERAELDIRRNDLVAFLTSEAVGKVSDKERVRMTYQGEVMGNYSRILEERIDAFE